MKILSIGQFVQRLNYSENIQNFQTWKGMSSYFDEVHLIVQSPDSRYHADKIDNIFIYWMPKFKGIFYHLSFMINSYKYGKKIISSNKIDVVDVGESIISGFPAVLLKRSKKVKLVVQVQGQLVNLPKEAYSLLKRVLCKNICLYTCKKADKVRAVSKEISQSLQDNGINKKKIAVVAPRCDLEMFDRRKYFAERAEIRRDINVHADELLLVFVGRLIPTKGVDDIIQALKLILDNKRKVKLLVVGDGPFDSYLKKQADRLGVKDQIIFYGRVPFSDVPKYLSAGDIFIAPSHDEAIARSIIEGMSMQMPVIATPVGGNKDVITHMENGILVPVNAPGSIANSVAQLMDDENLYLRISNNSRAIVETEFEYKKQIEKFANVYRSIEVL